MSNAALAFDTLQYSKKLKEVGFTEQQAEVQAEAIKEQAESIQELIDSNLATKSDIENIRLEIENVRAELKKDIENVRAELKRDIAEMGLKVTMRFGGMLVASVLVLAAIIKL